MVQFAFLKNLCYNFASSYYSIFFKKGDKMNTINYDKYSTMSINQLVAALTNAEKKQAKIEEKLKQELSEIKELIAYLKFQVKSNLDKPRFYNVENAPSLNALREEVEKMPQEQVEKIKAEVNAEMFGTKNV